MPLYFAYGANIDSEAMARLCPQSKLIGPARLARFRFFIHASGRASVAPAANKNVHGLLWDIALRDMRALDMSENIAGTPSQKLQQGVIAAAGARRALVYMAADDRAGTPRGPYMQALLHAGIKAELPAAYLDELFRFTSNNTA
ncbi:MAG: gamma-glutamylcyclotransferase [Hyphomicrobiales bacterium]|nr:gamma-glutamylcyclotransferase [Hyphomicrobiales bacterium]MDE2113984.1 gamma-glutamylcyclotransferase [Hyphomicrobiales bacterium]